MFIRFRNFIAASLLALVPALSQACDSLPGWAQSACNRIDQIWSEGRDDLYVSGYAWHNRAMYSASKIRSFNELAWGGGYGRSIYDEDGDWQGLYAMAFLDSHSKIEPIAGYGFLKIGKVTDNFKLGAGYTVFMTARHDIMSYVPFPGILPLVGSALATKTPCSMPPISPAAKATATCSSCSAAGNSDAAPHRFLQPKRRVRLQAMRRTGSEPCFEARSPLFGI